MNTIMPSDWAHKSDTFLATQRTEWKRLVVFICSIQIFMNDHQHCSNISTKEQSKRKQSAMHKTNKQITDRACQHLAKILVQRAWCKIRPRQTFRFAPRQCGFCSFQKKIISSFTRSPTAQPTFQKEYKTLDKSVQFSFQLIETLKN